MRRINKGAAPSSLAKEKRCTGNDWGKVSPDEKEAWANQLFEEQEGLDAYTEEILADDHRTRHIDHFRKRSDYPKQTFDWGNLFLANHQKVYGADAKDSSREQIDYSRLINPSRDDPQHFLDYNLRGEIVPRASLVERERERAEYTIKTFELNSPPLLSNRCGWICNLIGYGNQFEADDLKNLLKDSPFPSLVDAFIDEGWMETIRRSWEGGLMDGESCRGTPPLFADCFS